MPKVSIKGRDKLLHLSECLWDIITCPYPGYLLLAHFLHILNLLLNCICIVLTYIFVTKADVALLFGKIRPIQFLSTVSSITWTIFGSATVQCIIWLIYACPLSIVPKASWIVFTVFNTRNQETDTRYFQQKYFITQIKLSKYHITISNMTSKIHLGMNTTQWRNRLAVLENGIVEVDGKSIKA